MILQKYLQTSYSASVFKCCQINVRHQKDFSKIYKNGVSHEILHIEKLFKIKVQISQDSVVRSTNFFIHLTGLKIYLFEGNVTKSS